MKTAKPRILTINGGSSSIKFALSEAGDSLQRILAWQIERIGNMSAKQFNKMINSQSGLLGVSETHSDMRDLLDPESRDVANTNVIPAAASRVPVRVKRTGEERMIARSVWNIVKTTLESEVPPNAGMSIEGEGATQ